MKAGGLAVLCISLLMIGYSLSLSAAELDLMDRPGTIVHALSLPVGSSVYLDAVYVDSISQDQFVVREWWNSERTIVVSMIPPPALTVDQVVDIEGMTGKLADGTPAIFLPHVYGYLDKDGNLFPDPFVIKMPDKPADWPWGKVDMSTIFADEGMMSGMETLEVGEGELLDAILGTIAWAKLQTESFDLSGKVVTAGNNQFDGCIYIEEPDRSCGVKVLTSEPLEPGDFVDISGGTMGTDGCEAYITGGTVENIGSGTVPKPVFMHPAESRWWPVRIAGRRVELAVERPILSVATVPASE